MSAFIIVGIARSGTTLLERLLDKHSKIAVCPESGIFSTLFKMGAVPEITSQYQYDAFCEKVSLRLVNYNDVAVTTLRDFKIAHPKFRGTTTSLLQNLSRNYAANKAKIIVGEKTPVNVHYLDIIHQICPELCYVYITRQPLDICCSLMKLQAAAKKFFSDKEVLQAAFLVKRGLQGMYQTGISEQKIQIRYEDLVNEPRVALRPLCDFLAVNFEAEMLNFDASNYINSSNPDLKRIHQPLSQRIKSSSVGQFKRLLTAGQISLLNSYFRKEYAQLPYPIIASPTPLNLRQKLLLWQHLIYFHLRSLLWTRISRKLYLFFASFYFKWVGRVLRGLLNLRAAFARVIW